MNSRLDELQAAILSIRLGWLDAYTKRRKEIAWEYSRSIINPLIQKMAKPVERDNHVYHLYVIRCNERDRLAGYLHERGVSTLVHYPIPAHYQRPCSGVRTDPHGLMQAEQHAVRCLSIPCHPQMNDDDVRKVIEAINEFK